MWREMDQVGTELRDVLLGRPAREDPGEFAVTWARESVDRCPFSQGLLLHIGTHYPQANIFGQFFVWLGLRRRVRSRGHHHLRSASLHGAESLDQTVDFVGNLGPQTLIAHLIEAVEDR
ncbi:MULTISPECIES: hypothetical protein [Actinomycetes]|uniref:hypothetical protein n=1 Tax=Actinomycetes TaxID=1760 RepID=UPI0012DDFF99|nr:MULTISPECIES: hypothetical protein [Actinomycetes]